jgi:hypothetical protein
MEPLADPHLQFLRHVLASLAYRTRVVVRDAPKDFENARVVDSSRSAAEVLAHMGDLLDWSLTIAQGKQVWHPSPPQAWDREAARFFRTLSRLDEYLRGSLPLQCPAERLFQGPLADAFTHVGQLAMLRRAVGSAVVFENYFKANIVPGDISMAQLQAR